MSHNQKPDVHLNLNVRGMPVSATLAINERSNQMIREGRKVYKLGLGQSPFPVPLPVVEKLQTNAHQKDYLPVKGLPELRSAIAAYYRRTQNLDYDPENMIIGPGSKELMFILQLVYYGDLVIPTPSWVSYAPQAHIVGRHIHWLKTTQENDWLLMPEELDSFCAKDPGKPRILILNYPNNPTGATYSADQLKDLAAVAEKHRIILLSDEIYGEVNHDGNHVSIARYYPDGTIISSGLSKWCGAGGWRLGTFVLPKALRWLCDAMAVVASETFTSTSAPIQYAAVRAFEGGLEIERYLMNSRRILKALGGAVVDRLRGADVQVANISGGFYLFPDFSAHATSLAKKGITTSSELCERILEDTGVAFLPGSAFGRPETELTARMAYVDFDGAKAVTAAEKVPAEEVLGEDFLQANCAWVIEAIDRVVAWLRA